MRKKLCALFITAVMLALCPLQASAAEACNHNWSEWDISKSATIKRDGLKKRECLICEKVQTKKTAKLKPFVKLSKKTVKLQVSRTYTLKPKYAKGDSAKNYKSSNTKVATVSKTGKIKAKRKGTAKITITAKSGKKATCTVRVISKKKSTKNTTTVGGTVYWVQNGSVYHSTSDCPSLSRSRTINHGPKSSCPKTKACKICH